MAEHSSCGRKMQMPTVAQVELVRSLLAPGDVADRRQDRGGLDPTSGTVSQVASTPGKGAVTVKLELGPL
jgi:hypothetical protein